MRGEGVAKIQNNWDNWQGSCYCFSDWWSLLYCVYKIYQQYLHITSDISIAISTLLTILDSSNLTTSVIIHNSELYWDIVIVVKNLHWCVCIRSKDSYLWSRTKEGKSRWTTIMCPFGVGRIWADIFRGIGSWANLCQQVSGEILWKGIFPSTRSLASVPCYSYQQDVVLCWCWPVSNIIMILFW